MASRRARGALALLLALAVSAGCAGIPDGGDPVAVPNKKLKQADVSAGDVNAALPELRIDARPEDTITLLLDAAKATQNRDQLGERYLTGKGREAWDQPNSEVLIYGGARSKVLKKTATTAKILLTGSIIGSVSETGVYQPVTRSLSQTVDLVLDRVWLIDKPPPWVLVRDTDFDEAFRPVTLYFAARDDGSAAASGDDVLVPELRFLDSSTPTQSQSQVTPIVRLLLGGPSGWLAPVTRNPLPKNTALRGNVTFQGEDVVVDLSPDVESAPPADLKAFAAQVAWSLQPNITAGVRLQVNGRPLTVAGVDPVQGPDEWKRYNPAAATSAALHYVSNGGLRRFAEASDGGNDPQLGGQLAKFEVLSAALSTDATAPALALVKSAPRGRQVLWISDQNGGRQRETTKGRLISRPTWGHSSDHVLVAVDGVLRQVSRDTDVEVLFGQGTDVPHIDAIRAIRLSLDGTRLALIAGDGADARAYLGLVQRNADNGAPTLRDLRLVNTKILKVQDIAWSGPTTMVAAGQAADGAAAVAEVSVDGAILTVSPRTGLKNGALSVAATPLVELAPLLFVESGGQLYQGGRSTWSLQTDIVGVRAPFYPG